jgi:hypothetical protein
VTATVQRPGEHDDAPLAASVLTRRRGAALEDAILEAAYAELSEVGYLALSVEAVAARARTGKASIYRRWPTKQELVLDALCAGLPSAQQCGVIPLPTGDETTVEALHGIAAAIARILASSAGDAKEPATRNWLARSTTASRNPVGRRFSICCSGGSSAARSVRRRSAVWSPTSSPRCSRTG